MFSNLKQVQDYSQYQLRNQELVSENKIWPTLTDGSLVILLPDGVRCQSCNSSLTGEITVQEDITVTEDGLKFADQEGAKTRPMVNMEN